jgi:hypothetical protein
MPRPRKSAAALALSGAFVKHPERARPDVVAAGEIGRWRAGSSDPAAVWRELAQIAPRGVLTAADRPGLQLLALLIAGVRADPSKLTAAKATAIVTLLGRFGMTPQSRAQIPAPPAEEESNPFIEFVTPKTTDAA